MFYQLLVDRFDDNKDRPPCDPATARRGRDLKQGAVFQVGNLKETTRRLDYLRWRFRGYGTPTR